MTSDPQVAAPEPVEPEVSLAEIFNRPDPSDDDFREIIKALRARRHQFASLETAKAKGDVSKRARKLPGPGKAEKAQQELKELGIDPSAIFDLIEGAK